MSRFLSTVLGICSLLITVLLGWSTWSTERIQTTQSLLSVYSDAVSLARETCDPGMLDVSYIALEGLAANGQDALAERLSESQATLYASIYRCRQEPAGALSEATGVLEMPSGGTRSADGGAVRAEFELSDMAAFRFAHSRLDLDTEEDTAPSASNYFAVLAAYSGKSPASFSAVPDRVGRLDALANLPNSLEIRVMKSAATDFLVVVITPEGRLGADEATARDLTRRARQYGWSLDAFAARGNGWRVCENSIDPQALRSC